MEHDVDIYSISKIEKMAELAMAYNDEDENLVNFLFIKLILILKMININIINIIEWTMKNFIMSMDKKLLKMKNNLVLLLFAEFRNQNIIYNLFD